MFLTEREKRDESREIELQTEKAGERRQREGKESQVKDNRSLTKASEPVLLPGPL